MTLVLAFGVLGSAEAINRLTRTSGDLQTVTEGADYQIQFTVGLQPPSIIPNDAASNWNLQARPSVTDRT